MRLDVTVERATGKIGKERGSETVMQKGRERNEIGTRGIKTENERENGREIGRGNVNVNATGIVMGDETAGTGIAGMRGTGRNVLLLGSPLGSRGNLVGTLQGNPLQPPLRHLRRHRPDLQIPRPSIGLLRKVKTDWVRGADLLTMT